MMDDDPDSPEPNAPPASRVLARILPWFAPHRGALVRAALLLVATTALFQAGPLLAREAIDTVLPRADRAGLYRLVLAYLALQGLLVVLSYRQRLLLEEVGLAVVADLRRRLFAHAAGLSLDFHDKTPVGALIARIDGDAESLRQLFTFTALTLIGDALKLALALAVMASIHPGLTGLMVGILALILAASLVFQRVGRALFRAGRARNARVIAFLQERLQAVGVIQAYRQEAGQAARLEALGHAKYQADLKGSLLWNGFFNLLGLVEQLGVCLCLWWGGREVLGGSASMGTLVLFCDYVRRLFQPVSRLSEQLNVLQRALVGAGRLTDLLDAVPTVRDPPAPVAWSGPATGLVFEGVGFAYRSGEPVLREVSFTLPRGKAYALVGPTGGGKSTIVHLLQRFYDPTAGRVTVDGLDLRSLAVRDLRAPMALVLQEAQVFPGTVADNIRMGRPDLPDAAVRQAARTVGAEPFILALPQGYETRLAERGLDLSTGQRQLIAFARALARDPAVLILDEATASIDPETERVIQASLEALLAGRTALVVAHRLSTVERADRILVVEGGRIVEEGTHAELLARRSAYFELHRALGKAS